MDKLIKQQNISSSRGGSRQINDAIGIKMGSKTNHDSILEQLINSRLAKSKDNCRYTDAANRVLDKALFTDFSNPHVQFKSKRSATVKLSHMNSDRGEAT